MEAFTVEGLFRVPGDNDDVQELKGQYELDELIGTNCDGSAATEVLNPLAFDVHVW
jgi:hypothetical protein